MACNYDQPRLSHSRFFVPSRKSVSIYSLSQARYTFLSPKPPPPPTLLRHGFSFANTQRTNTSPFKRKCKRRKPRVHSVLQDRRGATVPPHLVQILLLWLMVQYPTGLRASQHNCPSRKLGCRPSFLLQFHSHHASGWSTFNSSAGGHTSLTRFI